MTKTAVEYFQMESITELEESRFENIEFRKERKQDPHEGVRLSEDYSSSVGGWHR